MRLKTGLGYAIKERVNLKRLTYKNFARQTFYIFAKRQLRNSY